MKFTGGGGGAFVKFEKVGDKFTGLVTGVREIPNKMNAGTMQTVLDVQAASGPITVALGPAALKAAYVAATAKYGTLIGRRVTFEFERTYKPKNGGNLGKEISIDVHDDEAASAPIAAKTGPVEEAYTALVAKKGPEAAAQIRRAVESVEPRDLAKQADLLARAAAA